jgi:ankyrin repeat protein
MVESGGEVAVMGEGEHDARWVLHSPLHLAAYIGDLAQLQETLKDTAVDSVDEYGRTAIMYSTLAEREECVEYLVKRGASLSLQDSNGQTAVHLAAVTGNYRCLRALLSKNPDLRIKDIDGRTPLLLATSHASSKCVSAILRKLKSHEINDTDNEKMTALHWSAYNNTSENVKVLMKAGADIAVTDMDGKSALHWTANNSDPSSAHVLLEMAPLSVNLRDNDGRTALHLAVVVGNRAIVETLMSAPDTKCDLSAADMEFRTALHWAAVLGSSDMVSLLLERGGQPEVIDSVGATPLHYAAQNNHVVRSLTDGLAVTLYHHSVVYVGLCVGHPIECSWYSGQW